MLGMLLAYDAAGNIIGTLDHLVQHDENGKAGLVNFAAHEDAGGEMTSVWTVAGAAGSKVWPEWLGSAAHGFRVELEGPSGHKRIAALVHKESGYRRERAALEEKIQERIYTAGKKGATADIRDLVGGPDRPIKLTKNGTNKRAPGAAIQTLPLIDLGE